MRARVVFGVLSSEAWTMLVIGVVMWVVCVVSGVSMVGGNPTAINGVIGCGIAALVTTVAGIGLARQDLRWRR
ncbi:hypothetical protein [Streptomyces sp. NPDC085596]|uniref:hypothetical protein n=1 Tax=Streptomyces sp. NPDC085596 TaxID=3365731 RepID=UPI0037D55611